MIFEPQKKSKASSLSKLLLILLLLPLIILAFTQNCSPMKAIGSSTSSSLQFSSDICAQQYAPNSSLLLSKVQSEKTLPLTLFEQNKNQLKMDSGVHTKAISLLNKKILVTLDTTCEPQADSLSEKVLAQHVGESAKFSRHAYEYLITTDIDSSTLSQDADNDPCVLGLTLDGELKTSSLPINDPNLSQQAHIGASFSHAYEYLISPQSSSQDVKVGFVDTGSDCSHPDLISNLVSNCGFDAISGSAPTDNDGHGSHTMGLTGAVMNNSMGVTGMSGNNIELHAIRVINVGTGSVADAYEGIQYAISHNLDVINISLESQARLALIEQGVQEAVAAGIVVVMAAGNQGLNLGEDVQVSPALVGKTLLGAITVGSVDIASGFRSSFSNYGNNVEIYATGAYDSGLSGEGAGGLLSLDKNSGYHRLMGTSQAAPIVTAAATLVVHFLKQKGKSYTPGDVEKIIEASTVTGVDAVGGAGAIDWAKLVRSTYAFSGQSLCGD